VELLAVAQATAATAATFATEAGGQSEGLVINVFWIIVAAANFVVFAALAWYFGFRPLSGTLSARRERIEQGLKDADAARRDRETAADQRQAILSEARREAGDIVARAQRLAEESREQELAETRSEIDRLRQQAVTEIDAERQRAIADVRGQVAELALAAAGKVVGETMTDSRQRRLVDDFLQQVTPGGQGAAERN
jgi:F-type H+-transporting ATPase subunit b